MINKIAQIVFILLYCANSLASLEAIQNSKLVSVIFVGQTDDLSASSFGHISLRFSKDLKPSITDTVVEFVADDSASNNILHTYTKGIGIPGYAFNIKVVARPYINFQQDNIYRQDRDIEIMEIDLSQNEITQLTEKIQNFSSQNTSQYSFLKKNCSYYAMILLEDVLNREINNKSHPWRVSKSLKESNLIKKYSLIPRGSSKLQEAVESSIQNYNLAEYFPNKALYDFQNMILSNNPLLKSSSYFELLDLINSETDPTKKLNLKRTYITIRTEETNQNKKLIKEIFKNEEQKKLYKLSSKKINLKSLSHIESHELKFEDNKVFIKIKITGERSYARTGTKQKFLSKTLSFEIPQIRFNKSDHSVHFNDLYLGRYINIKNLDIFLGQKLSYAFKKSENSITPYLLIDHSKHPGDVKLSRSKLNELKIVALNNRTDFKETMGTCLALVEIQRALIERAFFYPKVLPKNEITSEDKINLLSEALSGKYIVINGYSNIYDFTSSIDKELLTKFVVDYQYNQINKNIISQFTENISEQIDINKESITQMMALIEEGITIPLMIGTFHKGTQRLVQGIGHAILVYGIYPKPDGSYILHAYNPNFGVSIKFEITQDFKIIHPYYSDEFDYYASFSRLNEFDILKTNHIRYNSIDLKNLNQFFQTSKTKSISFGELLYFMKK